MSAQRPDNYSKRIEGLLNAVLPRGSALSFQRRQGPFAVFKIAGQRVRILWNATGWPAHIAEVLNNTEPDLVIAPRLSLGARKLLQDRAIGWLDESGAAEFALGTIVVSRTGIQHKKRSPKQSERWSPSLLATTEALLCKTSATVTAIADVTGLSIGACTKALQTLTEAGLLVADAARGRHSARRIKDENKLLAAYANAVAVNARKNVPSINVGGAWRDVLEGLEETGKRWDKLKVTWAVTGSAAAEVIAPMMTTIGSAVVYVDASSLAELEAIAKRAGLQPIKGGRLTLKPFPTVTCQRLTQNVQGLRVAPWPRIYADLLMTGVRGEDAAEHLREVFHAQ